jgi:2-polyprenyl-3-methyl-5-hydroxy-6-metoxy-1,4-benzoquinol methylase
MHETRSPRCPQCGTPSTLAFRTRDYNRHATDERFQYFECPSCRVVFIDPVPANLGSYYNDRYHDFPTREGMVLRSEAEQFKVAAIRPFAERGRLLEIGPSIGAFLVAARRAGFEVSAIELDPDCCRYLSDELGIRAFRADAPEDALDRVGPFDVLALWQVIEHLPSPWRTLPPFVERLSAGGLVVVSSPNPDSLQFRLLRGRWAHVDAPRHLELIPRATLDAFMAKHGLTPVFATYTDDATLACNKFGWAGSMTNLVPDAKGVLRTLAIWFGNGVSALMRPVDARPGNGSSYTVVYRKTALTGTERS